MVLIPIGASLVFWFGKERPMPSPFPGMDPYLEGYLWPDVHSALANKIRQQLTPRLRPRYVARLEIYVVEDNLPEAEIGIMYPDVEIMTAVRERVAPFSTEAAGDVPVAETAPATPAPLTIPYVSSVEVRLATVEIRDVAQSRLVTCIEILSPINKREPGLEAYHQKRRRLHRAGVHLLEIDLLRRGTRPVAHPRLPDAPYFVTLLRAQASFVEVWPIELADKLPVVPVPLRPPDPDVPLELSSALAAIYDEAAYELSVDYYRPPPPPPLSSEDAAWVKALLEAQ
jgi:hypothetical protein